MTTQTRSQQLLKIILNRRVLRSAGFAVGALIVLAGCSGSTPKERATAPPSFRPINAAMPLPDPNDPALPGNIPANSGGGGGGGGGGGSEASDEGEIAFTSYRDDHPDSGGGISGGDIFVMEADGSDPQNLTETDNYPELRPDWSHDGENIVFSSSEDGRFLDLYEMDADGGNRERLVDNDEQDAPIFDLLDPTYSPDGQYVALAWEESIGTDQTEANVGILNLETGNLLKIGDNGDEYAPAWSPDGSMLAYYGTGGGGLDFEIWTYEINSQPDDVSLLTDNSCEDVNPAWAPADSHFEGYVAYATTVDGNDECNSESDFEIVRQTASQGSPAAFLTDNHVRDDDPTWSPDGNRLAFVTDRTGNFEIFTMNSSDGGDLRNRTNEPQDDTDPDWSPFVEDDEEPIDVTGDLIVYESDGDLWVVQSDGSDPFALTETDQYEMYPNWDPTGSLVGYTAYDFGAADPKHILEEVELDSGDPHVLMDLFDYQSEVAYSPDGDQVAFLASEEGDSGGDHHEIWIWNFEDDPIQFTDNAADEHNVEWAADSTHIAWSQNAGTFQATDFNIWYANSTDPTTIGEVSFNTSCDEDYPKWGPEGFVLAFSSDYVGEGCGSYADIFVADLHEGSDPVQITNHPDIDWQPTWSPDGTEIAFSSNRAEDGFFHIFKVEVTEHTGSDSDGAVQLSEGTSYDSNPDWRPGG